LHNSFDFPEDWDEATVNLLRAAAKIRLEMDELPENNNEVTATDFLSFWTTSREKTSSSKSGRHFGHYRAACNDPDLVNLHVENINLAATMGTPLTRWKQGVTVLLEKVAGNIHIDKLRAICLLEADFNWWLKVIFAKRMVHRMTSQQIMPIEQGATSGKTTIDSSMLKQLFFDQSNILHTMSAVSSNDAANCYDAVNHAAGSFALQAMRVPLNIIKCYLLSIQTMRFFLKTGFGLAKTSYGGTEETPYMGLTQGSGASPAAWTAISTLIVSAYKEKGYGGTFVSAWSGIFLLLAALLYVDDTDLLHSPPSRNTTEAAFVTRVQLATYYWAKLLQATGGNLKPPKCYWYLMSYQFNQGIATLKPLRDIKQHRLLIPQPGSEDVEITLKDPYTASEVLGIWSSPSSTGTAHLRHMLSKGWKWSKRVISSGLTPAEVWHSFRTQAVPAVSYGLTTLMTPRQTLDDSFNKWYYTLLPSLGVNRNISKEWRTLPQCYQGLGLPVMSIEKLAASIQYLLRHWDNPSTYGHALRCSFELLQVETGLKGNFLTRDFTRLGCLATTSWFKQLWEYAHYYHVTIELEDVVIPEVRRGDQVFMELAILNSDPQQWMSINRTRKYFRIYFMSQLVLHDGYTVDPQKLSPGPQAESSMTFPVEQPTAADFITWRHLIHHLTSPRLRLTPKLGEHLRPSYLTVCWWTNTEEEFLLRREQDQPDKVYTPITRMHNTRRSKRYGPTTSNLVPQNLKHMASVKELPDGSILLQSTTSPPIPTQQKDSADLQSHLNSIRNSTPWKTLQVDGDGTWLAHAYERGTLMIVHDGSYMADLDNTRCSAAVVVLCTASRNMATITHCEVTDANTASNYRGELIGAVLSTSFLLILSKHTRAAKGGTCSIYCDNLGVVSHGNNFTRSLPEKQVQSDLICLLRRNIIRLTTTTHYVHVRGHMDDDKTFSELSLPQQLNVIADHLAKEALQDGISKQTKLGPWYPNEQCRVYLADKKVTSSVRKAIYNNWGYTVAQALFQQKCLVSTYHFQYISWDFLDAALQKYPQMFRTWVTKHVSGFCGTNRRLAHWDDSVDNICACCGCQDESTAHLTRCRNKGRQLMFAESVNQLRVWMEHNDSDADIIRCIQTYLTTHGEGSMEEIAKGQRRLHQWAREHDILGWDSFLEGRVSQRLFHLQAQHLQISKSKKHISTWARCFIQQLLNITHQQWLYRNARIHIKKVEGKTSGEHRDIMRQVQNMLHHDPDDLLPQHQHLLHLDFTNLGSGPTTDRQYWVANMTSALTAANTVRTRQGT
jgi:hypothetical protein